MERCANTELTNEYYRGIDKAERELDFFRSDTEKLFNQIEDLILRIREIEKDYSIELDDEIKDEIKSYL